MHFIQYFIFLNYTLMKANTGIRWHEEIYVIYYMLLLATNNLDDDCVGTGSYDETEIIFLF